MDVFNPSQLIALCAVFIGFHVLALPAFVWGIRRRQFAGREQKEWNLDDAAAPDAPAAEQAAHPIPAKARLVLGILGVFAVSMMASVFLVVYAALHAAAHPGMGQNP